MIVAIFTPSYFPNLNGMTYATHAHAVSLLRAGHEVHVYCGNQGSETCRDGVHIHRHYIKGSGLLWSRVRGDTDKLINDLKALSPDAIISEGWHTWGTHILPRLRFLNSRILLISHGSADLRIKNIILDSIRWLGYTIYQKFNQNEILKSLHGAAVLSFHRDNGRFRDYQYFDEFNIKTYKVPNSSSIQNINKPKHLSKNNAVTIVGEMSKNKNQLGALSVLKKTNKVKTVNFIYQKNNKYSKSVRNLAKNYPKIRFNFLAGMSRDELNNYISNSDLLIITSKTEAQPLVAIDALAMGTPFISTEVGCISSMKGGIVCNTNNMHEVIDQLLNDPDAYLKLSQQAIEYYKCEHSIQATDKALTSLLEGRE
jgi:glycosyltransferase involved in cell wall biosynthesis